jgi:hypothetical protein
MGLLGARLDALIPGLCPASQLLHVPLFIDETAPLASISELARALTLATAAGAKLINLSLAVLGEEAEYHRELGQALDFAEASGAVVVVAAGNQGRRVMGQLISHPVTVPVVAVDELHRLLRDSNFGPAISRRGVAAMGHTMRGYAPGGGTALMSGTSVATAVATGILAQVWSARTQAEASEIRAGVARLGPRDGIVPPTLDRDRLLAVIDRVTARRTGSTMTAGIGNHARLQGEPTMIEAAGLPRSPRPGAEPGVTASAITPAHGGERCTCGAPGGICTCVDANTSLRFIYVLGTVDIRFPDQSISEELQFVARKHGIVLEANEQLRTWYARVLREPDARYVARQVCWILKVEGLPAYCLALRDLHDLPDLISCLDNPDGDDFDLFVGSSSLIPVESCPGVAVPILAVDQLSSFKRADLLKWVKTPSKKKAAGQNAPDPTELFNQLVQSADNLGDTDEWRAVNYLAVNYRPLYERFAEMTLPANGWSLDSIKVAHSRLGREKRIVDPVFAFRHRQSGVVQKYFVRVDVTHLFPVLIHQISEYFDR